MVWATGIGVSVARPLLAPLVVHQQTGTISPMSATNASLGAAYAIAAQLPSLSARLASFVEWMLIAAWALSALTLLIRLFRSQRHRIRIDETSSAISLDGSRALVSDQIGPAAVSVTRPRISVPRGSLIWTRHCAR